ncbi:MAG: hypothetical protein ACSW8D_08520, partial [Prevotella sp.]
NMETVSKSARGRLGELTTAFTDLRAQYNRLTQEEKQGDFGKALNASLERLKVRIQDTKQELNSINQEMNGSKFGQFGGMIDSLGQKMGLNVNITELLTSKTAMMTAGIGAATAIVGKATQEWAKYNTELAKQDQITTVTTGLKGADSDRMTNQARALTDTYGVDFREAINAANTLMTQFGQSGEQAMSLIRDGMHGMIQGDGPKLLSMIQQYAPAFRDAGVSASQLVAVIQNSEGGIFTDQNMNAIVMGIKNIRLMTKATSDALAQLGIDGQKMSQQLRDGSMTIFDALKQVATQIQGVNSNSQAAGEVMQQVFGRQGAMAGTKLGEAIATLNTNLEETKRQTGEVGDAYNDLYNANVKLNGAIRDCFEYDGWDQMATGIKAKLVSALASVLDYLGKIKGALGGFSVNQQQGDPRNGGGANMDRMIAMLGNGKSPKAQQTYSRQIQAYSGKILDINDQIRQIQEKAAQDMDGNMAVVYEKQIRNLENRKQAIQRNMAEYDKRAQAVLNGTATTPAPVINPITNITQEGGNGGKSVKSGNTVSIEDKMAQMWERAFMKSVSISDSFVNPNESETSEIWKALSQESEVALSPLQKLREELAYLTKSLDEAADPQAYQDIKKVIEGKQRQIDDFTGETKKTRNTDKTADELAKIGGDISKVTNSVGSIFSGLQQMGIEIPNEIQSVIGVVNGISTILIGISTLLTLIDAKQDVQTFASIIPFYARGGVVPHAATGYFVGGNRRSGDTTHIMANAGELVLNESSQNSLAADILQARGLIESINMLYGIGNPMLSMSTQSALGGQMRDGGIGSIKLEAYVEGERLHLVHNRFLRRSGQGELVTWR